MYAPKPLPTRVVPTILRVRVRFETANPFGAAFKPILALLVGSVFLGTLLGAEKKAF